MRLFQLFIVFVLASGCATQPSTPVRRYLILDAGVQPFKPLIEEPYRWLSANGNVVNKGLADENGRAFVEQLPGETTYMIDLMWGRFRVYVAQECWKEEPNAFPGCAKLVEQIESCQFFECRN